MPLIYLSPWFFPLYHHFLPFAVTPSPWALSLPCAIIPSPWTFSFSYVVTFSLLPLFSFSFHGSFPSTIMCSPLPSLPPLGLFLSLVSSFSPLYHCYFFAIVFFLSIALSPFPSCVYICHCFLPFAITTCS